MDVNMPLMDGIESAKKIKEYSKKHNIEKFCIIACTAFSDIKTKEKCFEAGMDYFLKKPISPLEI